MSMAGGISAQTLLPQSLSEMLELFDRAYSMREQSRLERIAEIDSLRSNLSLLSPSEKVAYCEAIGEEFRRLQVDSAARWFECGRMYALESGDSAMAQRLQLKKIAVWPEMGLVKPSLDALAEIDPSVVDADSKAMYFEEGARLLAYVAWCTPRVDLSRDYQAWSNRLADSLLTILPADRSPRTLYYRALKAYHKGDKAELVGNVHAIMDNYPVDDIYFGDMSTLLGIYYKEQGRGDQALYYLGMGAVSDMTGGRLESPAIEELSGLMYERGDLQRASDCVSMTLENAKESGARLRILKVLDSIPVVAQARSERDRHKVSLLSWLAGGLLVALAVIMLGFVRLRNGVKRLEHMKQSLSEANFIKEAYMSRFLSLCSVYMEKLVEFQRLAARKINAAQYEDLYSIIKSGKLLEEQTKLFYDNFDDVFVKIYPTFVDEVNALLQPDRRISLPEGAVLNTELRIMAFMRLGVDDSARIARFLGLSLNTIYTYRNKLKGKALNRETFDRDVMRIGRIE